MGYEVHAVYLVRFPALCMLEWFPRMPQMKDTLEDICVSSATEETFRKGEEPFNCGMRCTGVLFIQSGVFQYTAQEDLNSASGDKTREVRHQGVLPGHWLSELTLW